MSVTAACLAVLAGGLVALAGPAQAVTHKGPATPFQLEFHTNWCIGTSSVEVKLYACNGADKQKWYPSQGCVGCDEPMFQQKASSLCLTTPYYSANSWVSIDTCTDQTNYTGKQSWFHIGDLWTTIYDYVDKGSHVCLGVTSVTDAAHLEMLPCDPNDKRQLWNKG